jgi:hypothetical protein
MRGWPPRRGAGVVGASSRGSGVSYQRQARSQARRASRSGFQLVTRPGRSGNSAQGGASCGRVLSQREGRQPGGVAERRRGAYAHGEHPGARGPFRQWQAALVHPWRRKRPSARDGGARAGVSSSGCNITVRTFYNVPEPADQAGRDDDERGLISGGWLARHTPIEEAVYYLCGPRPFLRTMVGGLARSGVALNRIRYEFFGPADELLAA